MWKHFCRRAHSRLISMPICNKKVDTAAAVKISPHHLKVKGSRPAAVAGTGREKRVKKFRICTCSFRTCYPLILPDMCSKKLHNMGNLI